MKKQLFNDNWSVKTGVQGAFEAMFAGISAGKPVTLPHDAMIEEDRDPRLAQAAPVRLLPHKVVFLPQKVHCAQRLGRQNHPRRV